MASAATTPDVKVRFDAENDTSVKSAVQQLVQELQNLKNKQTEVAGSADNMGNAERRAASSMGEARGAAKLLSEEAGIKLNRHLSNIIANSQVLGPLMEAAFPIAAAVGFAEVIADGAKKLSDLIADTFIFTDEMKNLQKANLEANKEIAKTAEHIKELKKESETIGLSGVAKDAVELRQLADEIDKVQAKISAYSNQHGAARLGILDGTGKASSRSSRN
jgi:cell fate (sporulation/competence/biofilm development) regulator YmcA (YheA/YmcA/DUF963 family)